jgi:predicted anti-sigma-YlaC factor YlaD
MKGIHMRHQPFETWIIDEIPLSSEQAQLLQSHLQECENCRKLSTGWDAARTYLLQTTVVSPAPGFTRRFGASIAERRYRQQQMQVRRTLLYLVSGSFVSLLALMAYLLFIVTPGGLLITVFGSLTHTLVWWNNLQEMYLPLVQSLPIFVPVALWILFTTSLSIFSILWVISIWRISTQGVPNK